MMIESDGKQHRYYEEDRQDQLIIKADDQQTQEINDQNHELRRDHIN